jgi:TPR repeat protein
LKRSAEEGFVFAQHMVGIAYHEGSLCQKNDKKALAWFRESVRNGNDASYLNAAELLNKEDNPQRNRLFSLVNYLGAYQCGAAFLRPQIE